MTERSTDDVMAWLAIALLAVLLWPAILSAKATRGIWRELKDLAANVR